LIDMEEFTVAAPQTPRVRPRRLRRSAALRDALGETTLRAAQLVHPLFVRDGSDTERPIASMPGHAQRTVDRLDGEVDDLADVGVRSVLLFGIPDEKDDNGSGAWDSAGPVPRAITEIKRRDSAVTVIADCVADRLPGHQRIVNLGHDLISKGQYYGAYPLIGRENLAHEICVPGPWHAEQLRPHLYIPIHVTGMSKLDGLFTTFDEAAFRETHGFAADERLLLWCPTFNPELTGLTVIGADVRRLTALGTVVIKLHGTTDPALGSELRARLAGDPRIRFVDPAVCRPAEFHAQLPGNEGRVEGRHG